MHFVCTYIFHNFINFFFLVLWFIWLWFTRCKFARCKFERCCFWVNVNAITHVSNNTITMKVMLHILLQP